MPFLLITDTVIHLVFLRLPMLETNPIIEQLKALRERLLALWGYL